MLGPEQAVLKAEHAVREGSPLGESVRAGGLTAPERVTQRFVARLRGLIDRLRQAWQERGRE